MVNKASCDMVSSRRWTESRWERAIINVIECNIFYKPYCRKSCQRLKSFVDVSKHSVNNSNIIVVHDGPRCHCEERCVLFCADDSGNTQTKCPPPTKQGSPGPCTYGVIVDDRGCSTFECADIWFYPKNCDQYKYCPYGFRRETAGGRYICECAPAFEWRLLDPSCDHAPCQPCRRSYASADT